MKTSFVFEMTKINIEPVTNVVLRSQNGLATRDYNERAFFLFAIWTLFRIRELIQKEKDDKSYVVMLLITYYKHRCRRERQAKATLVCHHFPFV